MTQCPTSRGMWLYTRETLSPYGIGPNAVEVGNWCRVQCVRRVYAGASLKALQSEDWLVYFRALKCALGATELFATFGLAEWADAGGGRAAAEWATAALALTDKAGQRLFGGVMLNVEPAWRLSASREQMRSWVDMHRHVLDVTRDRQADGPAAEAWFCLTWNLDRQQLDGEPLDRALLRASDGCAFMTYRSGLPALKAASAACLASSNAIGRPVRLTVECAESGEGPRVDFSRSTQARVGEVTRAAFDQLAPANPHLQGIDFHHYEAWRALPPG
jgi:hypothetical protein